jgi:hypothetical protein
VNFFPQRPLHRAGLMLMTLAFASPLSLAGGEASQPGDTPPRPATVPAGEVKPTDPTPPLRLQPALISVAAKQGGMVSFNDQEPSKLLGGVRLGYEEIVVLCDHVHYWQSKLAGIKRPVLDHALIASGPDADEPSQVVFDSRATKLPQISFRGVMRPREVEIIRQPLSKEDQALLEDRRAREKARAAKPAENGATDKKEAGDKGKAGASNADGKPAADGTDPATREPPILVRFRVLLHQFGEFTGDLKTTDGWSPHFGWAEEAEVVVVGDVLPDGIGNPRFSSIDLLGRPAGNGQDKRPARLGRKHIPLVGAAAQKEFDAKAYDWWAESSRITIEFDDQGRVLRIKTGADYRGEGTPSLETPVQTPEAAPPAKP